MFAENFFNLIQGIYEKPGTNVILNGENECFSPKVENKAELPILIIPTQHSTRDPSQVSLKKLLFSNKKE